MLNNKEPINWYGAYCLGIREVKRFFKVYNQTIIAPIISALIFLSIFILAIGNHQAKIGEVDFTYFIGSGLIIMTIVQNAFANSSSSLVMSKVIGYIYDILMPPLGGIEIVMALALGAIIRGIIVGCLLAFSLMPFISFTIFHPILLFFYTFSSCLLLGLLGILTGLMANSFEKNAAITSYIITPLSFLSGTFYSVKKLPIILQKINIINPFFYMIDGFRYSLTGHADSNITFGFVFLATANITLFLLLVRLINKGWRLKE